MRGTDFLSADFSLTAEQQDWLRRHPGVAAFNADGGLAIYEKCGRLAAVVASHPRREELAALIASARYTPEDDCQEHIARLLTHTNSPACEVFAMALIEHYRAYEFVRIAPLTAALPPSRDGNACFQFFTYGPYVLAALGGMGGAFDLLMRTWAMKRQPVPGTMVTTARYPGIEGLYDGGVAPNYHYLGRDGGSL
jgi:hypothetical protein